jgi:hypothetical protein
MTALIVTLVVVVVMCLLILRAMHTKGDVKAMFKAPLFAFTLEAKEGKKRKSRSARRPDVD